MSHWDSKRESRSFYRSLFRQESTKGLVQNQQQFNSALISFLENQSGTWGAYRALPGEVCVEEVFRALHIEWVFPRVQGLELVFCRGNEFIEGAFGILEPSQNCSPQELRKIQGLLVPGLAFNKNGSRLGKGKGFYDRVLEKFQGITVGVCFDFQISSTQLPIEDHDMKVDFLLSESGLVDCQKYQTGIR